MSTATQRVRFRGRRRTRGTVAGFRCSSGGSVSLQFLHRGTCGRSRGYWLGGWADVQVVDYRLGFEITSEKIFHSAAQCASAQLRCKPLICQ